MTKFAFSCVVDDHPVLLAQAFIWLNWMLRVRNVSAANIFVHSTDIKNAEFKHWFRSENVNFVSIPKFDDASPHCNKIQQLGTFIGSDYDQVVCMDCDTVWVGDRVPPVGTPVSATVCHYANPPDYVLSEIFSRAGLGEPDFTPACFALAEDRVLTDKNNCNGGIYIIDRSFIDVLEPKWRSWAQWGLENLETFREWRVHLDQVSFAMAMREIGAAVNHLDIVWNYPTNVPSEMLPDLVPEIIHYHREMTPHMTLKAVGHRRVDAKISTINEAIVQWINSKIINSIYWDFRYALHPDLGSGVGSRGNDLLRKSQLLRKAIGDLFDATVIDVGCGDLETTRDLPFARYIGLDPSARALEIARGKRPDWEFRLMDKDTELPEADVVLCLDVLIHQDTEADFVSMIRKLSAAARRRLVVTGYDNEPRFASEITRYYRPVVNALRDIGCFSRVEIIGKHRDTVMVAAEKGGTNVDEESCPNISEYYNTHVIARRVAFEEHRDVIGGLWDGIGQLQFEYLVSAGLLPEHRLIDIGCGCLRGGVHFVRYLAPGNYVGVDRNNSLLDAGYNIELAEVGLQDRLPRENLICVENFEFARTGGNFDFALAHSVFTHLPFNHIRRCLTRLAEVMRVGGVFFATFFELPGGAVASEPYRHSPGEVTTYDDADPYHYWLSDMFYAASKLPWRVHLVGNWNHPRAQRMLSFTRISEYGHAVLGRDKNGVIALWG